MGVPYSNPLLPVQAESLNALFLDSEHQDLRAADSELESVASGSGSTDSFRYARDEKATSAKTLSILSNAALKLTDFSFFPAKERTVCAAQKFCETSKRRTTNQFFHLIPIRH